LDELAKQASAWAEIIGPNIYLQAAALALVFILLGKIVEFVLSKSIAKIVSRSKTNF
jgi:hypothetical protein